MNHLFRCRLFVVLVAVLLQPLLASAAEPASPASTAPAVWRPERFPVSFWCGPPAALVNVERYRAIADAGFTHLMPPCSGGNAQADNAKVLEAARATGLKAFLSDGRLPMSISGVADAKARLDAVVADYANHPAFAGYFMADEPALGAFAGLGEVAAYLRQRDPAHPVYINLYPNYAPASVIGPTYEGYLDAFVRAVRPFALSYDHYHFTKGGDGPLFFENLSAARRVALRHDVPFWNIVLATAHGSYRVLTESEKRYEAMQTLAYGGKGLMWFTYWQPAADGHWGAALVNFDGTPTSQHAEVARINRDVGTIGRYLLKATSAAVLRDDKGKAGDDAPATLPVRSGKPGFTVGVFQEGDRHYALAANLDYRKPAEAVLIVNTRGRAVERLDRRGDQWVPLEAKAGDAAAATGVRVSFDVAAGDAELVRW